MSAMPPKAKVYSEHYRLRDRPLRIGGTAVDMIQAPKLEPRIMRYELAIMNDRHQTDAAEQAVRRVNDRRVLNGIFWVVRHRQLALEASFQ